MGWWNKLVQSIKKEKPVDEPTAEIINIDEVTRKPTTPMEKVKAAKSKTTPVTISPKKESTSKQTKASLAKMTKQEIDDLAKSTLGVDLDRRATKAKMIDEFMQVQGKG